MAGKRSKAPEGEAPARRSPLIRRAGGATRGPSGQVEVLEPGLEQIREDAGNGLTNATIAARLGVSRWLLAKLKERDPRVAEALEAGRGRLEDELTDILLQKARKGDTTAAIFLAKARCGWRDQGPQEGAQNVTNIQINGDAQMTTPQIRERVDQLLEERQQLLAGASNDDEQGQ